MNSAVEPALLSATQLQMAVKKADGSAELPFRTHAYICNITDLKWSHEFSYGRFDVKACAPDEEYKITVITDRLSPMDHGDKNQTSHPIGALHIAHDVVRSINETVGSQDEETGAMPYVGVFVCQGTRPTAEELAEAREKLKAFCEHYVAVADADFGSHRKPQLIPGFARRALKILKLERPEWAFTSVGMIECPACTTKVPKHAAICPNCKHVVNSERAKELGIGEASHEPGSTNQTRKTAKSRQSQAADRSNQHDSRI